jgi:membrane-associated phospholipid phosphatase
MRLGAIAAGIAVVAALSGLCPGGDVPDAFASSTATVGLIAGSALAGRPRPIPYLPGLSTRPFQEGIEEAGSSSPRHSTVLREAAVAGAAIGAGFLLDDTFEPGSGEGTAMDDIGQFIGSPFTLAAGSGVMWIGGAAAHRPYTVGTAKRLLISIAATTATAAVLKVVTDRQRPDESNDYSFPSGHSGASFAAATVLDRRYGGTVGWTSYGLATFVAASRVVGNHHFFSDVVAGAVIGRFFGRIFTMHD